MFGGGAGSGSVHSLVLQMMRCGRNVVIFPCYLSGETVTVLWNLDLTLATHDMPWNNFFLLSGATTDVYRKYKSFFILQTKQRKNETANICIYTHIQKENIA